MREIKFRGWDATGQKGWVFGDLVHNKKVCKDEPFLRDRVMVGGYEVVPESVGQFTGMKDCYGFDIYEGDVVAIGVFLNRPTAVVMWKDCGFCVAHSVNPNIRPYELNLIKGDLQIVGTLYEGDWHEHEINELIVDFKKEA